MAAVLGGLPFRTRSSRSRSSWQMCVRCVFLSCAACPPCTPGTDALLLSLSLVSLPPQLKHGNHWCDICKCFVSRHAAAIRMHEQSDGHKGKLADSTSLSLTQAQ